ncbi:hypothetical protein ACFV4G_14095 [Kitasatospora sp. NPDC059747]|uniref:hypothetical protein n=1 Tax=Kitasatospora sp. NPDC059747 TaxID=3346930 RepID=UPI003654E743
MGVKRAAVVGGVVLALAGLAGCGSGDEPAMSAGTVLEQGHKQFAQAASVKITGSESDSGQKMTFAVSAAAGGDCTGSFDFGDQGKAELLRSGGQTLFKEDERLLARLGGDKAVAAGKDHWLRIKDGDDLQTVTTFCDLKSTPVFGDGDWYKDVVSEGTATVDGRKAAGILATSSKDGSFEGYVATDGPARPLRVESPHVGGSSDGTTMDFSDYDAPVTVSLPPADRIIDLDSLKQS